MNARRSTPLMVALLLSCVTFVGMEATRGQQSAPAAANSKLLDAAKATLKAMQADYEVGRATVEDIYRWSKRVMEAEQQAGVEQAAKDHLARMRELHDGTVAKRERGREGGEARNYQATAYYLAEAQIQ